MSPKMPDPPVPEKPRVISETVAEEGTARKDFAVNPLTGQVTRRRQGLRGLKLPSVEQTTTQNQNQ